MPREEYLRRPRHVRGPLSTGNPPDRCVGGNALFVVPAGGWRASTRGVVSAAAIETAVASLARAAPVAVQWPFASWSVRLLFVQSLVSPKRLSSTRSGLGRTRRRRRLVGRSAASLARWRLPVVEVDGRRRLCFLLLLLLGGRDAGMRLHALSRRPLLHVGVQARQRRCSGRRPGARSGNAEASRSRRGAGIWLRISAAVCALRRARCRGNAARAGVTAVGGRLRVSAVFGRRGAGGRKQLWWM